MLGGHGLRQLGVQETDIVTLVSSITKYAVCVKNHLDIRYELERATHIARSGRPGPVWLDIPLDVQSKEIEPSELKTFRVFEHGGTLVPSSTDVIEAISMLKTAKRPVLIVGYGVRLAGADARLRDLVEILKIPVISSWTASDMLESPYHIGHMGIFGDRAGNFTVQNADFLLVIGCRLSIPQIGYDGKAFAPNAKIVMVDVDRAEIEKPTMHVDLGIVADALWFINDLLTYLGHFESPTPWLARCLAWRERYPVNLPEYAEQTEYINSFHFIDQLSEKLPSDAIVVLDQGTAFTCTMQTFKVKLGQRLIHSSGHSAMGYGLPGAIGACFASGKKKVICIVGDGALQFNLQELATIVHWNLPIIIFVLNNDGYLTIKKMQDNHFKRRVGSDMASGLSCPDTMKIAEAYGIAHERVPHDPDVWRIAGLVDDNFAMMPKITGPYICEVFMDPDQPLIPRVMSQKQVDGSIKGGPIHDLFPYLPREEFAEQMRSD